MSPTNPATYEAGTIRPEFTTMLDDIEYKHQHAIITKRGVPKIEALPNDTYAHYCTTAAGLNPHNMVRIEPPRRSTPTSTIPRIDWDDIDADRVEVAATYVLREFREFMARVSLSGMHVRVIRHNHASAVFVPPEWAEKMRELIDVSAAV